MTKTLSSADTDIPSIVWVPERVIFAVVATLHDSLINIPCETLSTYDLFAASFALLGVSVNVIFLLVGIVTLLLNVVVPDELPIVVKPVIVVIEFWVAVVTVPTILLPVTVPVVVKFSSPKEISPLLSVILPLASVRFPKEEPVAPVTVPVAVIAPVVDNVLPSKVKFTSPFISESPPDVNTLLLPASLTVILPSASSHINWLTLVKLVESILSSLTTESIFKTWLAVPRFVGIFQTILFVDSFLSFILALDVSCFIIRSSLRLLICPEWLKTGIYYY